MLIVLIQNPENSMWVFKNSLMRMDKFSYVIYFILLSKRLHSLMWIFDRINPPDHTYELRRSFKRKYIFIRMDRHVHLNELLDLNVSKYGNILTQTRIYQSQDTYFYASKYAFRWLNIYISWHANRYFQLVKWSCLELLTLAGHWVKIKK